MNTPEISIIVPVYNVEQYLEECLESLANQTFANFEVICVDDGSTDASGLMLDRFAEHDARFKVFHKENAGVSSARNFALSKAVGDYIFFVDSDDYIEANTCEKLLELAHRDNSDIVVYGGDTFPKVDWIDNAFNTEDVVIRGSGAHALFHESGSYPLMCNKMYRRTLIADNGLTFNESLKLGEDNAFQFSVFPYAHTVTFTRDLFYHYRCAREGSAINELYEDRFSKIKKHLNVVEYVLGYWSDKGFLKDWKKELLLWSSVFLIDDLKHLPFRDRKEISSAYRDICEKTELLDAVSQLEESGQKVWRFVAGELALGDSPIATVLLVSSGASENNDNILSILDQSLQNIELFYIWSEEAPEPAKACFKGDSRVRFASTPNEALAQARSKYILTTSSSYRYDWLCLDRLVSELEQGQADIATCLIYADNPDRLRNVERVIKTRGVGAVSEYDSSPQDWKYSCNAADIPEYIGGALTANLADKLFRAELFKSFESIAWDTLQAPEMLFGQAKVAFLPFCYIEQVPVSCGFEKASELGQSVIACAQSSLAIVPNDSRNKYKSSWAAASAIAFLGAYERIADKEGKRAFLESAHMADGANAVIEQILSDPLLDTGYRERLNVLWREEPQDAMVSELTLRAKEARKEQRRFEDVEFYFATENYEFYHSITYRFGRMFVDSAKKCLSLFSRVKREEIHSK